MVNKTNVVTSHNLKYLDSDIGLPRDRGGQWAVYFTSPKGFIITFSYSWA